MCADWGGAKRRCGGMGFKNLGNAGNLCMVCRVRRCVVGIAYDPCVARVDTAVVAAGILALLLTLCAL